MCGIVKPANFVLVAHILADAGSFIWHVLDPVDVIISASSDFSSHSDKGCPGENHYGDAPF